MASAQPSKPAGGKASPVKLFGQIDELSYISSGAGVRLTSGKLPARVAKVSLGSAAAYSGLREGDAVLDARVEKDAIIFKVERKGKIYQAQVATNTAGLKADFERRKIPFSFGDSPFDDELKQIGRFNVVVMLDRSESMGEANAGIPGDLSKWEYCRHQLDNLYVGTERVLERGFDLVLFNNTCERRNGVTLWDLRQVFQRVRPEGGPKRLSQALSMVLNDYFYAKRTKPDGKPLLIMVMTDGGNEGTPLQDVLMEASHRLTAPGEVKIVFLQIGNSYHAEDLFEDLDRNLIARGARYHMADYKSFSEVRNKGLLLQLVMTAQKALHGPGGSALAGQR